jgi:hypothetical protein
MRDDQCRTTACPRRVGGRGQVGVAGRSFHMSVAARRAATSITAMIQVVDLLRSAGTDGVGVAALPSLEGSSATRRSAMMAASGSDQWPAGVVAISPAKLSIATAAGKSARRPASCHGSISTRANVERIVSVIPLASLPTAAYRKAFRSECPNSYTSVPAMPDPRFSAEKPLLLACVCLQHPCEADGVEHDAGVTRHLPKPRGPAHTAASSVDW